MPAQRLEPRRRTTVLVIDELGKMRATEWERTIFDDLISSRYQAKRTTLFATNFPVAPPEPTPRPTGRHTPQRVVETLEEAVGSRIFQRLRGMG